MTHFKQTVSIKGLPVTTRQRSLFSVSSRVTPHAAETVSVNVRHYFVGTVNVGEVTSSGHDTRVTEPNGITLLIPIAGRLMSEPDGGRTQTARPGEAILFSPNRRTTRVEGVASAPFLAITLVLPASDLHAAMEKAELPALRRRTFDAINFAFGPADIAQSADLLRATRTLYSQVLEGSPRLLNGDAHRSWSELLSDRVLACLVSAGTFEHPPRISRAAAARHVRRATEYMLEHHSEIDTIADVAAACETGIRNLEAAFRAIWSRTPYQALTDVRFQSARRDLVHAPPEANVTDIAFANGFSHLGRFSGEYMRRYGELPSETLRRGGIVTTDWQEQGRLLS